MKFTLEIVLPISIFGLDEGRGGSRILVVEGGSSGKNLILKEL